jgi:hypothetical protein
VSCFDASIGGTKIANRGTVDPSLVSAPVGLYPPDVSQAETILNEGKTHEGQVVIPICMRNQEDQIGSCDGVVLAMGFLSLSGPDLVGVMHGKM